MRLGQIAHKKKKEECRNILISLSPIARDVMPNCLSFLLLHMIYSFIWLLLLASLDTFIFFLSIVTLRVRWEDEIIIFFCVDYDDERRERKMISIGLMKFKFLNHFFLFFSFADARKYHWWRQCLRWGEIIARWVERWTFCNSCGFIRVCKFPRLSIF